MEYDFVSIVKDRYLHVIGSGAHSVEDVRRFLLDTNQARIASGLDAVLLEARFVGRSLNFGGIYSIIADNQSHSLLVRRIAYVETVAEHRHTDFAELAAHRLGLNARMFRTIVEAEKWLSSDDVDDVPELE